MKQVEIPKINRGKRIVDPLPQRLLSIKQAALYLGLTVWAIRERIWSGEIPVVRFGHGRKMYIDVSDIDRFIDENKMTYR